MDDLDCTNSAQELLQAVRLLAAAFPRASWTENSEAVYVMAMAEEGVTPAAARGAVRRLIRESYELPPVAAILRAARENAAESIMHDWRCPLCGSEKVAGIIGGPGVCFECVWEGTLP